MTVTDDRLSDLAREALDLGINGRRLYRRAAAVTGDRTGERLFRKLADDGVGRVDKIGRLAAAIAGTDDWKQSAGRQPAGDAAPEVVTQLEAAIAGKEGGTKRVDDVDMLRLAMNVERRAIALAEALRRRAPDAGTRELAEQLLDEQQFHYDLLQAQADSLMNVGIWLDAAEFRMDGKY